MNENPAQALLEELLWRAMDQAAALESLEHLSPEDRGALTAYLSILDWGRQGAENRGLAFNDPDLRALDFDAFLMSRNPSA